MEISDFKGAGNRFSSELIQPENLLTRLRQLGSIQAQVLSISKGQAILASPLGRILTANVLDLKIGDRLIARADASSSEPKLKISRPLPESGTVNISAHKVPDKLLSKSKPTLAVVTGRSLSSTMIRVADQTLEIDTKANLPTGQLVSLKKNPVDNRIELRPLNHQQILKSAIKQLLPDSTNPRQSALTGVMVLLRTLGQQSNPQHPVNQSNPMPADKQQPSNLLDSLLQTIPRLKETGRLNIRQWLNFSLNPGRAGSQPSASTVAPFQVLARLAESEAEVIQQLRQYIVSSSSGSGSTDNPSAPKGYNEEILQAAGRDLFRLAEQSVGQQLLQQTNLRLQQELQQPLAINVSIPVTDHDNIAELRLKIKQRNPESDRDTQAWDIDFDFEFGDLGFISTHLLLKEQTLSASFWSMKPETQQQIEANLEDFQQQIIRAGLTPGQFHSFQGRPHRSSAENSIRLADSLLDIRV